MEQTHLLGSAFDCSCGKHHVVPTDHLIYNESALESLPAVIDEIEGVRNCLIIADSRTFNVAGNDTKNILDAAGIANTTAIVPDTQHGSPHTDDHTRDLILDNTTPADLYIAIGSGVINDLVKWVAYLRKKPYIVVATAASMNGYASANVAATIDGLKVLFHADAPKAVFVVPSIILNAPFELTTSGLGDVLAKSVSSADWKLNSYLFQDYYCQFSVDLLKELEPVYLNNPDKIHSRDADGFKALFNALFYSSIAMTVTGTSSPASGGEHLISHTLDIIAGRDNHQHDLHGRQVGVASILMAAIYERIMSIDRPQFFAPPQSVDADFWGSLSPIVEKEYQQKLPKLQQAATFLSQADHWNALKGLITPGLIPAKKIKDCLMQAGAAHRFSDIRFNQKPLESHTFQAVVNHAHQMRARFTILDLALLLRIFPQETDQIIADWVTD